MACRQSGGSGESGASGETGASPGGPVGGGALATCLDVDARGGGSRSDGRNGSSPGGEPLWKISWSSKYQRHYYYNSRTREVEWDLPPGAVLEPGDPASTLARRPAAERCARVAAIPELSESESPSPAPWPPWADVAAFAAHRRALALESVTVARGRSPERTPRFWRRRRNTSAPLRRPRPRCWHDIHWMPRWWHDSHWTPCGGAVAGACSPASRRRPANSRAGRRASGCL